MRVLSGGSEPGSSLTDPAGKNLDEVRTIRDDIRGRVEKLLAEFTW